MEFVAQHPTSRAELRSLLQLLDEGQAVILDQIPDATLRLRLREAIEALGLRAEVLPDGSSAYAAPDNSTLLEHYGSLLQDTTDIKEPAAAEPAEPLRPKKMYGAAAPPPQTLAQLVASEDIGPSIPPTADDDSASSSSCCSGSAAAAT